MIKIKNKNIILISNKNKKFINSFIDFSSTYFIIDSNFDTDF